MKKLLLLFTLFVGSQLWVNTASSQEIFVKIRPTAPAFVRPPKPRPEHIWVESEWVCREGKYVFMPGYWTLPRRGYHFVPGYWKHTRRGNIWIRGVWKR